MILLTGANGHLGANLLRRLLADGAAVRVLLRPDSDNSSVDGLGVERVFGDLPIRPRSSPRPGASPTSIIAPPRSPPRRATSSRSSPTTCSAPATCCARPSTTGSGASSCPARSARSATARIGPTDENEPFNPFERHLPYALTKAAVEHECLKAVADGLRCRDRRLMRDPRTLRFQAVAHGPGADRLREWPACGPIFPAGSSS